MTTPTHGTLTKWNDDRGFGFITPALGSAEIFVHISAFPHDGIRPRIGELISYELEQGDNGKMRAVRIMRPGTQRASRRSQYQDASKQKNRLATVLFGLSAIGAIGVIGYKTYIGHDTGIDVTTSTVTTSSVPSTQSQSPRFQCDGRQHCSQMESYDEARFFIQHCPNTKMDGDGDGIPCESQFNR
jgi:cold shock CspA family protein